MEVWADIVKHVLICFVFDLNIFSASVVFIQERFTVKLSK